MHGFCRNSQGGDLDEWRCEVNAKEINHIVRTVCNAEYRCPVYDAMRRHTHDIPLCDPKNCPFKETLMMFKREDKSGADGFARFAADIERHYLHEKAKHPFFADVLVRRFVKKDGTHPNAKRLLKEAREQIAAHNAIHNLSAFDLLTCELYEAAVEIKRKNTRRAIEELFDSVAVILRMVDVLQRKEKLGGRDEV